LENNKLKSGLVYGLISLLLVLGGLSCYVYVKIMNNDCFAPGVAIGGISVQGNSLDEAEAALNHGIEAIYATGVTFYKEDYQYQTKLGELCLPIDSRQVVQSAWQQEKARSWRAKIANLNGKQTVVYPVDLAYNPVIKDKLVQEWNTKWGIPSKNATLEMNNQSGIVVIPGQAGMEVDAEATFISLPTDLNKITALKIPIIVIKKEPEIADAVLSNMGRLSSYSTNYDLALENRSHNLYLAASSIDKSIVAPHTVFSFNNTLGHCTAEKGYLDAMVIVQGKFEPGLAGGICQVSSTLYNASLLAGMDIMERRNHSLAVTYVPLGRDATVANGSQDFKFMNNTDDSIYIRATAAGGRLTISIYGNLKYKKKIEISNIIDQTIDFTILIEQDPTLKAGEQKVDHNGQLGYVVRSFRTFYGEDGKILKTEQLARDTYDPLNKLIYMGPEPIPEPVPAPILDTVLKPPVVDSEVPVQSTPSNNTNQVRPDSSN